MGKPWALDSHEKLVAAGYEFIEVAPCKSPQCAKEVRWYKTPKGHMMPFSQFSVADGTASREYKLQPHFADCKDAANFTSRKKKESAA